jgi:putative hydrolase of HD superfamily
VEQKNNKQHESKFDMIKLFDKSKTVNRRITHLDYTQENDAEHGYMAALLVIVLDDYIPPHIDRLKLTQMLLIHDLVEVVAGDVWYLASTKEREQKKVKEREAAASLFASFPLAHELWLEYEERETDVAIYAKMLDIIQAVCTIVAHGGVTWKQNRVTQETEMAFSEWIHKGGTPLGEFLSSVFDIAIEGDMFYTSPQ